MRNRGPRQRGAKSKAEDQSVAVHEMATPSRKMEKFFIRFGAGLVLVAGLGGIISLGHVAVALLLVALTFRLFTECVSVGYSKVNSEKEIPWYRTLQWAWFFVAMSCAYGSKEFHAPFNFTKEVQHLVGGVGDLADLAKQFQFELTGALYSATFVATVLSFKKGFYAVQLNVLSFTILALSLFVVQLKMAIHNVYMGLFWFVFPLLLVAANDTFAYLVGFAIGKRFIKRPLLELSPNKTWEGFLGGAVCTMAFGYVVPKILSRYPWMTCTYEAIQQYGGSCTPSEVFWNHRIQWHGLVLACYASFVAPFGGFFASGIKRAYGQKDFASLIPGHGGLMDRCDCQFLMAAFTWIHVNTFVHKHNPVGDILALVSQLSEADRKVLLEGMLRMSDRNLLLNELLGQVTRPSA